MIREVIIPPTVQCVFLFIYAQFSQHLLFLILEPKIFGIFTALTAYFCQSFKFESINDLY